MHLHLHKYIAKPHISPKNTYRKYRSLLVDARSSSSLYVRVTSRGTNLQTKSLLFFKNQIQRLEILQKYVCVYIYICILMLKYPDKVRQGWVVRTLDRPDRSQCNLHISITIFFFFYIFRVYQLCIPDFVFRKSSRLTEYAADKKNIYCQICYSVLIFYNFYNRVTFYSQYMLNIQGSVGRLEPSGA